MMIWGNAKRFWFHFSTHRYDGFKFWKTPEIVVRLGWLTFAVGKYKHTNTECFELDKRLKVK